MSETTMPSAGSADPSAGPSVDSSRREFIKSSTVAVVGGSLATGLLTPGNVHAQGDGTLKIGLIGSGSRGSGAAKDALSAEGPVKLVAMGDAFQFRLDASLQALSKDLKKRGLDKRFDVPKDRQFVGLDAYKKVLACDVDLVILATPPGFRPQQFAAAVAAGKHVFMEEPLAVDAPGVHQVLEAAQIAKQKKLAVGVGLQRHHQTTYQETIKRLKDGVIGDIHTMRAYWNGKKKWTDRTRAHKRPGIITEMQYQVDNWYYFTWLSGDHICEQHIHNLDVCNWLKGAYPVEAQGMGGREVRTDEQWGEIYDHHAVEFVYEDGARTFSFCRQIPGCWDSVSEHAQGSKGTSLISSAKIEVVTKTKNGIQKTPWQYRDKTNAPYRAEHENLQAAIRKGQPYNEAEYGAMSTMTSILGRMCTYSGKRLTMKQALASKIKLGPEPNFTWNTTPPVAKVAVPGLREV